MLPEQYDRPGEQVWHLASVPGGTGNGSADGAEQLIRLTPRMAMNEVDAMLAVVREGRGIGRALSYRVAEDMAAGRLVRLLPEFEPAVLPVHLVTPSAPHMAPKARAFIDFVVPRMRRIGVSGGSENSLPPADID